MEEKNFKKLKLLYLYDLFISKSDSENILTVNDIAFELEKHGITAERKSIYSDIECLREFGLDIAFTRSKKIGYYLKKRKFSLAELRILTDAVLSAKFITPEKTTELINKISEMASIKEREVLLKLCATDLTSKHKNESIYTTIENLTTAINKKHTVSLKYSRNAFSDFSTVSVENKEFEVSPYTLILTNNHYYLVCNNSKYDNLMHIRLDRISNLKITDNKIRNFEEVCDYRGTFDGEDYCKRVFNMFAGKLVDIKIKCDNSLVDVVLDRFSDDISLRTSGTAHFTAETSAVLSNGLASWIMQYGNKVEVLDPPELKQMIIEQAQDILSLYRK